MMQINKICTHKETANTYPVMTEDTLQYSGIISSMMIEINETWADNKNYFQTYKNHFVIGYGVSNSCCQLKGYCYFARGYDNNVSVCHSCSIFEYQLEHFMKTK